MHPKKIESSIIIKAPLSKVWQALADFENYQQWNPFTPRIDISPQQLGSIVGLHVRLFPKLSKTIFQNQQLVSFQENNKMEWGVKDAWYLRTARIQQLTAIDKNTTRYYTSDTFEGPLTWFVLLLFKKNIQIGFDDLAQGLKTYVEKN